MAHRTLLATSWILLAIACDRTPPSEGDASPPAPAPASPADPAPAQDEQPAPPPPPAPPTAAEVAPWMGVMGPPGAGPDKIAVHVARDAVADGTVLRLEPALAGGGQLKQVSPSTFEYQPATDAAFRPGTRYTATLASVGVGGGVVQSDESAAWQLSFETPALELRALSSVQRDAGRGDLDLRLAFTAAVDPGAVARHARVTIDGRALSLRAARRTSQPHVVRLLTTSAPPPRDGAAVSVAVRAGIPWALDGSLRAPAGVRTAAYGAAPVMQIRSLARREGPAGHFVEVICDDAAAAGRRDVWDPETYEYYSVSGRCLPTADSAAEHISTQPKLDIQVSASRGGFRILGDFARGPVTVRLSAGLRSVDGALLAEEQQRAFVIPARKPTVRFAATGRYLPKRAWRRLAVRHMNTPELHLQVRHIPKRNLSYWLSQGGEHVGDRVSDLLLDTRLPAQAPKDQETTTWVDVGSLVADPAPGVYEIAVRGGGGGGRHGGGEASARSRLLLTDMSLIAKASRPAPKADWTHRIHVWALGMAPTEGRFGVDVALITASGRTMTTCRTDFAGGCVLQVPAKEVDPSPPMALIASSGVDFTYLKLSELTVDLSEHDVQGDPYRIESAYRAGLYADRGVYRPGETAHVVAMIRGRDDAAPPAGLPVELQVVDSRARVARRLTGTTGEAGAVAFDVALPSHAPTGRWSAKALIGKAEVGRVRLQVEEFVPERMKVQAKALKPDIAAGEVLPVRIDARYLFGGSAKGSPVEVTCRIEPHTFRLPDDPTMHFGPATGDDALPTGRRKPVDLGVVTAELDGNGELVVQCPGLDRPGALRATGRVMADVAVLEAGGGRASRAKASASVHPDRLYVGLSSTGARQGRVRGVVVDWRGKLVEDVAAVDVSIAQLTAEHGWWWDEERGTERWERRLREAGAKRARIAVSHGRFDLDPAKLSGGSGGAAGLLVRATAGAATSELYVPGDSPRMAWYDPWGGGDRTPRPGRPAPLPMQAPQEVRIGVGAEVRFKSPFRGRALLTVETHEVLTAEWRDVVAGDNTWSFSVAQFAPNVYVSALVIKDPLLESADTFVPGRALGLASIAVKPERFERTVTITAPDELRPNSVLPVTVRVSDGGGSKRATSEEPVVVTIAAVDEGILSLTGFNSPDPAKVLFAQRALAVDTHETIGWSLRASLGKAPSSSTGGDEEFEDSGPGRPMPVKPVALWSGLLSVSGGVATAELQVPQYRGQLRIMAVAIGRTRVGAASRAVKVRDPLVLQTTLPRYLAGDDLAQVPVFVTNTTAQGREVTLSAHITELPTPGAAELSSTGPSADLLGGDQRAIKLAPGESGTAVFKIRALRQVGAITLRVAARSGDLRSYDEADVPLLAAGPRVRRLEVVELAQGDNDLTAHLTGWQPGSESTTVWATAIDRPEAFGRLSYLLRYPYGCVEQTTSSARPLLYLSELLRATAPAALAQAGGVDAMVKAGVDRLLSMQTSAGGFSYWPGSDRPVAWGTAYAAHFLLDAKERRHAVPEDRLGEALDWLAGVVDELDAGNSGRSTEAYVHFVLARAGRARKARVSQLLAEHDELDATDGGVAEARFLLLAALHLAGDRSRDAELKRLPVGDLRGGRQTGHGYYSEGRRKGLTLATFVDLFGRDAAGAALAADVGRTLSGKGDSRHYTTQELAWGITGLGKWHAKASGAAAVTLAAGGIKLKPSHSGDAGATWVIDRASERPGLSVRAPKLPSGGLRVVLSSIGVPADPRAVAAGGQGLQLTRQRLTPKGQPWSRYSFDLGQVIHTRILLTNSSDRRVDNIVLVDRLPAGWEIENPRLGRSDDAQWVAKDAQWKADHMEIRDDRIELFGGLGRGETVEVVYAARAVAAGQFAEPPVEAEAMYDPQIWARAGGSRIQVDAPWDAQVD